MSETITVRAKVISAKGYSNNFSVLRCEQGKLQFPAVGVLHLEGDLTDTVVSLTGRWDTHSTFGQQFRFDHVAIEGSELFFFLTRLVKGLGEKLAQALIDHYGEEELVRTLDEDPAQLKQFKGIKEGKLGKIVASWQKYRPLQELAKYLAPYGIPAGLVVRIYNRLGDGALKLLRQNPYQLTRVPGIGFKKAGDVALKIGLERHDPFRIDCCLEYVLDNLAEDAGDTLSAPSRVVDLALKELNPKDGPATVAEAAVYERITALEDKGDLVRLGEELSLSRHYRAEQTILDDFRRRLDLPRQPLLEGEEVEEFIADMESELGISAFGEEQRQAIRLAADGHKTFIVTGYAGTGKSTISKAILRLLARRYGEDGICCMALSGIAADRIRKTSGFPSATIHTTLGWKGDKFEHDREKPLPVKVVLLDESSMVNSHLFRRALDALSDDTVFVMLGDPAQLPPIGAGDIFADLVESRLLPMVQLTRIYRQSDESVLVFFANEVRQGKVPEAYKERVYQDFEFIDRSLPRHYYSLSDQDKVPVREENTRRILAVIEQKVRAAAKAIEDPVSDFQILSPMRKGPLGTETLNLLAQEILNPGDREGRLIEAAGRRFKLGDKVVHTSNKDMQVVPQAVFQKHGFDSGSVITRRVFNGSVGMIVGVDPEEGELQVNYPGVGVVRYETMHLGDILEHAYALSVHKAQGSEYQNVILPVASLHTIMLNAKWLYTALTRAKRKIVVVGQRYCFEKTCKSLVTTKRCTVLQNLLLQLLQK